MKLIGDQQTVLACYGDVYGRWLIVIQTEQTMKQTYVDKIRYELAIHVIL